MNTESCFGRMHGIAEDSYHVLMHAPSEAIALRVGHGCFPEMNNTVILDLYYQRLTPRFSADGNHIETLQ